MTDWTSFGETGINPGPTTKGAVFGEAIESAGLNEDMTGVAAEEKSNGVDEERPDIEVPGNVNVGSEAGGIKVGKKVGAREIGVPGIVCENVGCRPTELTDEAASCGGRPEDTGWGRLVSVRTAVCIDTTAGGIPTGLDSDVFVPVLGKLVTVDVAIGVA